MPIRGEHPVLLRCRGPLLLQRKQREHSPGLRRRVRLRRSYLHQEQGQRDAQRIRTTAAVFCSTFIGATFIGSALISPAR